MRAVCDERRGRMYLTCPKCAHVRADEDDSPSDRCPACGLSFQVWMKNQFQAPRREAITSPARDITRRKFFGRLVETVLYVEPRVNGVELWGRLVVFVGLLAWGMHFIFTDWSVESGPTREIGDSFMHTINLVFHEAGHVLFIAFGEFMMILGGSLFQIIVPGVVMAVFLFRYHNTFGASVGLWWIGQSLMDLAPYIGDAREGELILLGGHTGRDSDCHDWANLLSRTGTLENDRIYAARVDTSGEILVWVAIVWGAVLLYRQFKNRDGASE